VITHVTPALPSAEIYEDQWRGGRRDQWGGQQRQTICRVPCGGVGGPEQVGCRSGLPCLVELGQAVKACSAPVALARLPPSLGGQRCWPPQGSPSGSTARGRRGGIGFGMQPGGLALYHEPGLFKPFPSMNNFPPGQSFTCLVRLLPCLIHNT
jgi:hypothetical protein